MLTRKDIASSQNMQARALATQPVPGTPGWRPGRVHGDAPTCGRPQLGSVSLTKRHFAFTRTHPSAWHALSRKAPVTVAAAGAGRDSPVSGRYDYIIVGGGAAGCVLANRLSADPSKRVLVLEAGGENNSPKVRTPAGLPNLFKSTLDWNLYSVAQNPVDARQVYMARGKLLGGSSATNATLYMRGIAADYDAWGVPGWDSRSALDWFLRAEDNARGAEPGVHAVGGSMHVEDPRYQSKLHDAFFAAAQQAGLPFNPDFNNWQHSQLGYGEFQVTQERGERADAFRQYLAPALGRSNLTVLTRARCLGVATEAVSGLGAVALGVRFQLRDPDGPKHAAQLSPDGEVILAAGAVHTPYLLQLSGIGPAEHLKAHGIPVIADLPGVGENLQDHAACLVSYLLKEEAGPIAVTDELLRTNGSLRLRAILNYALRRRGPLTTTGCDHGAFVDTKGTGVADLQIRLAPALALDADGVNAYVHFARLQEDREKWPSGITFQLLGVRPRSRGTVRLRSSDAWDPPLLNPGHLSDPKGEDLATLRNGVRLSRQLAQQPALKELVADEYWPGRETATDAEINSYIKGSLHSGNALTGTAKMAARAGDGAVVDSALRVFGVRGLRVADSSVIPVIPGGQTSAATVMVAERAAETLSGGAVRTNADREVALR